jgi:hypothetical protein
MRRRKAPTVACFCLVGEALAKTTAECIVLLKEDNSRFWDKSVSDYLKKQVEVDAHDACGGGENVARDELSTELEVLGSLLLQKGVLEDKFDQRTRWSLATFKPGTFDVDRFLFKRLLVKAELTTPQSSPSVFPLMRLVIFMVVFSSFKPLLALLRFGFFGSAVESTAEL